MTVLDRIKWPAVYAQITAGRGAQHSERVHPAHRAAVNLAVAVLTRREAVKWALAANTPAGTLITDLDAVTDWLCSTAHLVHRYASHVTSPESVTAPREQAEPGRLRVDERLTGLPLLPLARDLAVRTGGLIIEARQLPLSHGYFNRETRLIALDPGKPELALTFAHELSHVLDPDQSAGDADQAERFAEALASLLLAHLPETVATAEPLIKAAAATIGPRRSSADGLPAPGLESLARFLCLPLLADEQAT